jgi:hypothetical protein
MKQITSETPSSITVYKYNGIQIIAEGTENRCNYSRYNSAKLALEDRFLIHPKTKEHEITVAPNHKGKSMLVLQNLSLKIGIVA